MTRLRQSNGDDFPAAAQRHLEDAGVLQAADRPDGAAYLAGYVVECAMKTMIQVETGWAARSHDLAGLDRTLSALSARVGAQTARHYARAVPLLRDPALLGWNPAMRYRGQETSQTDAAASLRAAGDVYRVVIGGLALDGELA